MESTASEHAAIAGTTAHTPSGWTPQSWQDRLEAQQVRYTDADAVVRAVARMASFPPLVTSGEVDRLRELIAEAQAGKRFLLQGGDCAETLADCTDPKITALLKILLQMSVVLVHGLKKPVIRLGRMAGQYAKPRSSATEVVNGLELPSYFGDLVNAAEPTPEARTPDPMRMIAGYQHSAVTLNFIRSLIDGGFADLHHPEQWELGFLRGSSSLSAQAREEYERFLHELGQAIEFMESLGDARVHELSRMEFFTSHEALNLHYESAQTRQVPRKPGYYDLTTHLPWCGERTRQIDGAHVEFLRGVRNPVGVKIGPTAEPDKVVALLDVLNPRDEPGKIVLITRMGADVIESALPGILEGVARTNKPVLWISDPMHGNTEKTASGVKTRNFDKVLAEVEAAAAAHQRVGTVLGGVHLELTGEDVTECVGGARNVTEADLDTNFQSLCDPRLNYGQALELAFLLARKLG
ncbi:MAG: 3-deoxy-7-phosphoheptulonate synthase class II [Planctomycetota bacterium]